MSRLIDQARDIYFDPEKKKTRWEELNNNHIMKKQEWDSFLLGIMQYAVISENGSCDKLWNEVKDYPKIYTELANFKRLASEANSTMAFLMLGKDDGVYDRWGIEKNDSLDIRKVEHSYIDNKLERDGFHILHFNIGSGKSELIADDIGHNRKFAHKNNRYRSYGPNANQSNNRILVITPNQKEVWEVHKKLAERFPKMNWQHYHRYGNTSEDVIRACKNSDCLVICAASIRKFKDLDDSYRKFNTIYVDELAQVMADYPNSDNPPFSESLQEFYELVVLADRAIMLSADITEANTLKIWGRLAKAIDKKIYYYKNLIDYAEGMTFTFFDKEFDIVWETIQRINNGERCFGITDFANNQRPYLSAFIGFLNEYCPDKKIHAYASEDIQNNPLGQRISDVGLQNFIEEQTENNNLDAIFVTPWAKTNISVLFDKAELYGFDFSCGIHRYINNPWSIFQSSRRCRQITDHLLYVKNTQIPKMLYEESGKKRMPKQFNESYLEGLNAPYRAFYDSQEQAYQLDAQNSANRILLTKRIIEERGGIIKDYDATQSTCIAHPTLREIMLKKYKEDVLRPHNEVIDYNLPENRALIRDQFSEWNSQRGRFDYIWDETDIDYAMLHKITEQFDEKAAFMICQIAELGELKRAEWDRESFKLFAEESGKLLDRIFTDAMGFPNFAKLCKWYMTTDSGITYYYELPNEEIAILDQMIEQNYAQLYQPTLRTTTKKIGRLHKFLTDALAANLELEIYLQKEYRKRAGSKEWRNKLFDQYRKTHPTKMIKSGVGAIEKNFQTVDYLIREKIRQNPCIELSWPEQAYIDNEPDILKIRKPERPIMTKMIRLYQARLDENPQLLNPNKLMLVPNNRSDSLGLNNNK